MIEFLTLYSQTKQSLSRVSQFWQLETEKLLQVSRVATDLLTTLACCQWIQSPWKSYFSGSNYKNLSSKKGRIQDSDRERGESKGNCRFRKFNKYSTKGHNDIAYIRLQNKEVHMLPDNRKRNCTTGYLPMRLKKQYIKLSLMIGWLVADLSVLIN